MMFAAGYIRDFVDALRGCNCTNVMNCAIREMWRAQEDLKHDKARRPELKQYAAALEGLIVFLGCSGQRRPRDAKHFRALRPLVRDLVDNRYLPASAWAVYTRAVERGELVPGLREAELALQQMAHARPAWPSPSSRLW